MRSKRGAVPVAAMTGILWHFAVRAGWNNRPYALDDEALTQAISLVALAGQQRLGCVDRDVYAERYLTKSPRIKFARFGFR